jgi:2-polyprenyl-3-methyl-5-hydroxy-6-metoxy-1,4-benzoquinol methylase
VRNIGGTTAVWLPGITLMGAGLCFSNGRSALSVTVTNPTQLSSIAPRDNESTCAQVTSLFKDPWLKGYVRGKLRIDPMYGAVFECLRESRLPILDLGCGIGILLYYLRHRGLQLPMIGVDWDAGRIAVAQQIAQAGYQNLNFIHQDARKPIQFQGHVLMLDLLHYIEDDGQRRLLQTVAASIAPGGSAVIRQCPRDSSNRFILTNVVERLGHALRWHKGNTINFPTHETIAQPFRGRGFIEEIYPMWGRTPFNNYLFVFRRPKDNDSSSGTMNG